MQTLGINSELLNDLRDIRIELLHYWSEEKVKDRKDLLSNKLNKLDKVIMILQKREEQRTKLLGGVL
jgi:uncharacterized protein (DUF1919 family)